MEARLRAFEARLAAKESQQAGDLGDGVPPAPAAAAPAVAAPVVPALDGPSPIRRSATASVLKGDERRRLKPSASSPALTRPLRTSRCASPADSPSKLRALCAGAAPADSPSRLRGACAGLASAEAAAGGSTSKLRGPGAGVASPGHGESSASKLRLRCAGALRKEAAGYASSEAADESGRTLLRCLQALERPESKVFRALVRKSRVVQSGLRARGASTRSHAPHW